MAVYSAELQKLHGPRSFPDWTIRPWSLAGVAQLPFPREASPSCGRAYEPLQPAFHQHAALPRSPNSPHLHGDGHPYARADPPRRFRCTRLFPPRFRWLGVGNSGHGVAILSADGGHRHWFPGNHGETWGHCACDWKLGWFSKSRLLPVFQSGRLINVTPAIGEDLRILENRLEVISGSIEVPV